MNEFKRNIQTSNTCLRWQLLIFGIMFAFILMAIWSALSLVKISNWRCCCGKAFFCVRSILTCACFFSLDLFSFCFIAHVIEGVCAQHGRWFCDAIEKESVFVCAVSIFIDWILCVFNLASHHCQQEKKKRLLLILSNACHIYLPRSFFCKRASYRARQIRAWKTIKWVY